MGKPAARIGDMHVCPMVSGTVPHVGGPIIGPGVPTILIGGMPAAVMSDNCICAGPPDIIAKGSTRVFFGGKPAARMGDKCAHGGSIVVGCPTVLIGEKSGGMPLTVLLKMVKVIPALAQVAALKQAAENGAPFCQKCHDALIKAKSTIPEEEYEKAKEDYFAQEKEKADSREIFLNDPLVKAERKKVVRSKLPSKYPELTVDELTAIRVYTSDLERNDEKIYGALNTQLRKGNLSDFNKGLSDLLCSSLNKLPLHQGTLYRGTYGTESRLTKKWKVGDKIQFMDFKSTSSNRDVASDNFSSETGISSMYVIEGSGGSEISPISSIKSENEVLYKPNSTFRVKEINPKFYVFDENYENPQVFRKITLEFIS